MSAPGDLVGSYELIERLGQGGMGEVWVARHRNLGRSAAVKVIGKRVLGSNPTAGTKLQKRFEREARTTAHLTTMHVVQIFDFGTGDDGSFYYAMELLDGVDLMRLVQQFGPLSAERTIHLLLQAVEGLAEAHRAGLVHRDIKPANLFLCRLGLTVDVVKILDFGLVKMVDDLEGNKLTTSKATMGSPAFIAPEVVLGHPVDQRSDIYAIGCVAYWLLTGKLVFDESSVTKVMMAHVQSPPTAPSLSTEIGVPKALDDVILACLEKLPNDRPQSGEEVAALLRAIPMEQPWSPERAQRWWSTNIPPTRFGSALSMPAAAAPVPSSTFRAGPQQQPTEIPIARSGRGWLLWAALAVVAIAAIVTLIVLT